MKVRTFPKRLEITKLVKVSESQSRYSNSITIGLRHLWSKTPSPPSGNIFIFNNNILISDDCKWPCSCGSGQGSNQADWHLSMWGYCDSNILCSCRISKHDYNWWDIFYEHFFVANFMKILHTNNTKHLFSSYRFSTWRSCDSSGQKTISGVWDVLATCD